MAKGKHADSKTVKVDSDLHAELKIIAAKEKKTLEVVVEETLKKGLEKEKGA